MTGDTEDYYDYIKIWSVPDRANPAAAKTSANFVTELSGPGIDYNDTISSLSGMLLLRFLSDESNTFPGWAASWSVPRQTAGCVGKRVAAASGTITDGSGSANYANK